MSAPLSTVSTASTDNLSAELDHARQPMRFSKRVEAIPQALSIYINQLVYDEKRKGHDITTLSLGEAFFDIPPFSFKELDFTRGYHYSDSQGVPELRQLIADFYQEQYGAFVDADEELLISTGSKPIIFMAMQAIVNAGEEVLIQEPAWLSYQEQTRLLDAEPRFIPYDAPVERFVDYLSDKTRLLILNNPNNPAGRIYTRDELEAVYLLCRSRGIYVMIDEAYSDFVMDPGSFHSMAKVVPDKDGILVVNSLSKNMGMSGWRVGYLIAAPALIQQVLKLNQHLITCAPTILQFYMARYFKQITDVTLPQVKEVVLKRQRIAAAMERIGLQPLYGPSTFYFFIRIDPFPGTSLELALYLLLEHQIAVVPGSAYGDSTERFIRVSIGSESEERIIEALQVIQDVLHQPMFDAKRLYRAMANKRQYAL